MKLSHLHLIFATALGLAMASCASPSISEEEWKDIGASVTSSMKFYIAVEKTEAQAQERYGNRLTLDYYEWDTEECIHQIRLATLKHLASHFHETSEWEAIPTLRNDFNANEVWTDIKDAIPSASKKLRNAAAVDQVKWTIDNVVKEYDRLNRVEFKLPEFVSKSKDREVFKSYCTYNDTYYKIVRTSDSGYLWDFSMPFFEQRMIDQSFSAENFEKIFNIENRKGNINRDTLSAEYIALIVKVRDIRGNIKELKEKYNSGSLSKDEYFTSKDALNQKIKDIQLQKETVLYENLKKISDRVNSPTFRFIFSVENHGGKPTYEIGNDIPQFYALKQLQYNIRKTFKVKQSDRYRILKQIKLLLSDGFPKIVIRTDIESFYESIPQDKLLEKVLDSSLLTHKSKQFIQNIIEQYEKLKNKKIESPGHGVPRGVGISAYLSELYMNDVDRHIKSIGNVTFYARYVDDIFIIVTPPSKSDKTDYLKEIEGIFTRYGLKMKTSKTKSESIIRTTSGKANIEYLGYSFDIDFSEHHCNVTINLTQSKINKYEERIRKTFDHYNTDSKYDERAARKLLFNRLRFLTANTKLLNSKEGIKVGVYYSNSLLEEPKFGSLTALNGFLREMVYTNLFPHCIGSFDISKFKKQIINQFDFCEGFKQKRFHNYTTNELIEIKKIW